MINENLLEPEQRTEQWYIDRSGKFTGSRFKDLLAKDKDGKPLKAYHDLIMQLVGERLTGRYQDSDMDSYSLRHGREVEPYARQEYELETGAFVMQASFIQHPIYKFVGASPDGLIGDDGGLEIKCPKDWDIHLARFENGMEEKHLPQVQGCMWVTGRKWWDFVSYDPRVNEHLRFYRQRVWRDDKYIAELDRAVMLAEHEVRERLINFSPERIAQILIERVKEKEPCLKI